MKKLIIFLVFMPLFCYGQMQQLPNCIPLNTYSGNVNLGNNQTQSTIDAVGESIAYIGYISITGNTGSKTISAAGSGKVRIRWGGTITWANAATNVKVGIQDVNASGIEDGTYDVYADLVPGTETITASTANSYTMESGTKTISQGDFVAIVVEMTARGGTDAIGTVGASYNSPYSPVLGAVYQTTDIGSGPTKAVSSASPIAVIIEFDDGTIGWFTACGAWSGTVNAIQSVLYGVNTAGTDEYAAVFQVPFKCSMQSAMVWLGGIASTDNFDIIFYTDPLGTPVANETISYDPDFVGSTTTLAWVEAKFTSDKTLMPNTWYAVAVRPTTNNTIQMGYWDLLTGWTKIKAASDFGLNIKWAGRLNQTGAFTELQTYQMPVFRIMINKLDAGRKEQAHSF